MPTDYGLRLRAARKHAGLTQEQLRDLTGVPQSTISTAEREGRGSAETAQYARACGVSAIWLATGEGEMVPATLAAEQAGSFSVTTAPAPMSGDIEQRLTRFLAVLHQIAEARRAAALAAATEVLLDHLPPPPTGARPPGR